MQEPHNKACFTPLIYDTKVDAVEDSYFLHGREGGGTVYYGINARCCKATHQLGGSFFTRL